MMLTAEMRFWWRGDESQELRSWLKRLNLELSGVENRTDVYFKTDDPLTGINPLTGIKLRGGEKLEVKKQTGEGSFRSSTGEHWNFNTWKKIPGNEQSVTPADSIEVRKQRWLTVLDEKGRETSLLNRAQNGCQIEVSKIHVGNNTESWTSFCLEAYGAEEKLKPILQLLVDQVGEFPPMFQSAMQTSYPEWLALISADPE
ncbi:hypothetical protein [Parasphingorhabdus sp.]|uniref:hypothetical protein n=1 Tax=Parasphingorhabdus sp. TaxID=2709688 RepID=UPI002F9473A1